MRLLYDNVCNFKDFHYVKSHQIMIQSLQDCLQGMEQQQSSAASSASKLVLTLYPPYSM